VNATNQVPSRYRDTRRNVEINVGKACNNKCVFCLDGMPKKEDQRFIAYEVMRSELERWYEEGHRSVGFLGGEPTMYPRIADSIRYARELGYSRIALATNAMMFRRERFVDELLDAGLSRVTVSMHGHTRALEDRLTDVPGAFDKKCQALANLRRRRDEGLLVDGLSVNIVLNGWNYRQLPKMMRFFFEEQDLEDLRVNFVRPEGYAEGSHDLTPTFTEVVPVLMKAILLNEYHFRRVFTFGGLPLCVLPKELLQSRQLLPKYCGDLFRDLSTDCSIRSDGFADGVSEVEDGRARFNWQDRKRFDLKPTSDTCAACDAVGICEGVWGGYQDIYGTSEIARLTAEADRFLRHEPRLTTPPRPTDVAPVRTLPHRLVVLRAKGEPSRPER
jgi:MoaA/NifB/PqqE/SkfB family radical SAM enzyme